ncbi:LIM and senescent cell antigen-like-containing domain protein 1 [Fundulus heteroclitus]|uniref:LIM and senescent cell antigen-like-containing domain protein 1 n=1 Tax=Fundulus heteroclitus TaxID=8078 RepID=UPI00165C1425|nr:LIM and senescent cell antigen-like-containing domain protein 1 [Fundulus heteroclitus]
MGPFITRRESICCQEIRGFSFRLQEADVSCITLHDRFEPNREFIIGRVIKAMNNSWHPDCFCCDICQAVLADVGFVKNAGRKELTADARELKEELFCLPCHDKMGVPICGACRRPIVVNAMGKQWHVEHLIIVTVRWPPIKVPLPLCKIIVSLQHFVCAKCEKPFLAHRHYERKGLAYCETHYNQLFGDVCYHCNRVIEGDVVSALNKAWCVSCFSCSTYNTKLTLKNKFVEFDMKPVCKKCYEKFPLELKKRLKKLAESLGRK